MIRDHGCPPERLEPLRAGGFTATRQQRRAPPKPGCCLCRSCADNHHTRTTSRRQAIAAELSWVRPILRLIHSVGFVKQRGPRKCFRSNRGAIFLLFPTRRWERTDLGEPAGRRLSPLFRERLSDGVVRLPHANLSNADGAESQWLHARPPAQRSASKPSRLRRHAARLSLLPCHQRRRNSRPARPTC